MCLVPQALALHPLGPAQWRALATTAPLVARLEALVAAREVRSTLMEQAG